MRIEWQRALLKPWFILQLNYGRWESTSTVSLNYFRPAKKLKAKWCLKHHFLPEAIALNASSAQKDFGRFVFCPCHFMNSSPFGRVGHIWLFFGVDLHVKWFLMPNLPKNTNLLEFFTSDDALRLRIQFFQNDLCCRQKTLQIAGFCQRLATLAMFIPIFDKHENII